MRRAIILIALCLFAAVLASCGGGGGSDKTPQQLLESATLEGVESADFDLSLAVESEGKQGGDVDVDVSGRVASEGIQVTAKVAGTAKGKPADFEGGLTLFDDHGFVNYQGTEYEVDPNNYEFAKSLFVPALSPEGRKAGFDLKACPRAASTIQRGKLVDNLREEGSADVEGTETTKLSGEVEVAAVVAEMIKVVEDPDCLFQVSFISPYEVAELKKAADELADAGGKARVELYVGDDDIVRRFSFESTGDPKGKGRKPVAVDLELTLSEVNGDQKIKVPSAAKGIGILFTKLGIEPLEFLGWKSGGEGIRSLGEKVAADAFPAAAGSFP